MTSTPSTPPPMRPVPADAVREPSRAPGFTWRWYDPIAVVLGFASAAFFPFSVAAWVLLATFALLAGTRVVGWWRSRSGSTRES